MDSSIPVAEPPKTEPTLATPPVMDVVPPPQALSNQPDSSIGIASKPPTEPPVDKKPDAKANTASKPTLSTRTSSPSPTLAIIASVIIVLALSAMATVAYIKTK